jgi:hypothetical protein
MNMDGVGLGWPPFTLFLCRHQSRPEIQREKERGERMITKIQVKACGSGGGHLEERLGRCVCGTVSSFFQ